MLVLTRKLRPDRKYARTHLGDGTVIELTACTNTTATFLVSRTGHEPYAVLMNVGDRRVLYPDVKLVLVEVSRTTNVDSDRWIEYRLARVGFDCPRELTIVREEVL